MDLNEEELKFPCQYPIKVIGYATQNFKKQILGIVHSHFKRQVSDDLISFKMSKNNKYLSITVDFMAESRSHVNDIYRDLKDCQEVVCLI